MAQIIALTTAGIQTTEFAARRSVVQDCSRHGIRNRAIVPRLKKALARRHHGFTVAGIFRALFLNRQQMYVTLPRNVEAMALRTSPGFIYPLQRVAVEWAGEGFEGSDVH